MIDFCYNLSDDKYVQDIIISNITSNEKQALLFSSASTLTNIENKNNICVLGARGDNFCVWASSPHS